MPTRVFHPYYVGSYDQWDAVGSTDKVVCVGSHDGSVTHIRMDGTQKEQTFTILHDFVDETINSVTLQIVTLSAGDYLVGLVTRLNAAKRQNLFVSPSEAWGYVTDSAQTVNPELNAWSLSDLSNAEFGVIIPGLQGGYTRVTQISVIVDYSITTPPESGGTEHILMLS